MKQMTKVVATGALKTQIRNYAARLLEVRESLQELSDVTEDICTPDMDIDRNFLLVKVDNDEYPYQALCDLTCGAGDAVAGALAEVDCMIDLLLEADHFIEA